MLTTHPPRANASSEGRLLVVDDEADVLYSFCRVFERAGYAVAQAKSGEEAMAVMRSAEAAHGKASRPDVVVMDVRMPGAGGLETLKELRKLDPRVPVVLMTAYASAQGTIEAMKAGAFDYVAKPFDLDRIREVVREAVKASRAMRQVVMVEGEAPGLAAGDEESAPVEALIGRSEAMRQVFKQIGRVAGSDLPVLVTGESGTGKELVARAIYQNSARAARPFLALNCAAIPGELLESELFGHRRGSFTGASADKLGKFEACDGGTLFLDEIGELPVAAQAKLLRVLETGELEKVGEPRPTKVDVRLIAATNRDLKDLADAGRFRPDLYYRLRVFEITLPLLRSRAADLPMLAEHLLARHAPTLRSGDGKAVPRLDPAALARLQSYDWPGNVRELENCLRGALVRARGPVIRAEDLELEGEGSRAAAAGERGPAMAPLVDESIFDMLFDEISRRQPLPPGFDAFDVVERKLIIRALSACGNNQSKASRFLGITRNTLRKRIQKYGLKLGQTVEE